MPRSLTGRILAAIAVVAVAIVVVVGAATFVVLRGLHADATRANLESLADSLLPQVRDGAGDGGGIRGALDEIAANLAEDGIEVGLVTATGQVRDTGGAIVEGDRIALPPAAVAGTISGGTVTLDGVRYLYGATNLRVLGAAGGPRGVVFLQEDRSGALALADLGRAIPVVILVVVAVGLPLAWLVSRSVVRPISRIAAASAELASTGGAGAGGSAPPLPLEGPTEVRDLTRTYNGLAAELAATRDREARLLADLRHDLRTPLTVIGGFAEALADGTATGPDAERAARAIADEAARLEALVAELGTLERLRTGAAGLRPEPIDVGELLAATVERFAGHAAAEGVELAAADVPPGLGGLVADRSAVDRILANLVANASAAVARPGGRIWLSAQPTRLATEGRPRGPAPASAGVAAIALAVADDGPGFPPGTLERAFERFYRADPARSGTGSGLGLSIVVDLARAHGGTAVAENLAPRGARVSVILPLVPSPAG